MACSNGAARRDSKPEGACVDASAASRNSLTERLGPLPLPRRSPAGRALCSVSMLGAQVLWALLCQRAARAPACAGVRPGAGAS